MDLRKLCGERIRQRRLVRGWTQQELAKFAEIPYPTLSRLEHGEQSTHYERLAKLADVLQVSADDLLGRTEDPRPPRKRSRTPAPVG